MWPAALLSSFGSCAALGDPVGSEPGTSVECASQSFVNSLKKRFGCHNTPVPLPDPCTRTQTRGRHTEHPAHTPSHRIRNRCPFRPFPSCLVLPCRLAATEAPLSPPPHPALPKIKHAGERLASPRRAGQGHEAALRAAPLTRSRSRSPRPRPRRRPTCPPCWSCSADISAAPPPAASARSGRGRPARRRSRAAARTRSRGSA